MGNSYRIRTTPGDDKNINLQIDQNFETLEILSLKIRQQDVYNRMCADYGIIAGRVFANKGYGIPNVKISIFIPLREDDENNPVITALYPFKNLDDRNEDGYKYNLLPYYPQYPGHVPTGTFPTRVDALINDTVVELYDKYYKYTVTSNDSGDFLIYGVPVGEQTLVMNLDLSDMGPFSLTPQDLIRMGLASESDFDGVNFKSSTDFSELPQIVVLNKTIEVVPFWGEEDTCQIGISRADFDVTSEKNLDIQPTAVFMGSLMSSNEKSAVKQYNVAKKQTGELCKLITGPGEIIALTQTIFRDENGLPILERAPLPNGGKLIDGNGTWMFELPMNAEYVTTNEFGQLIISDDPKVGIPTRAKYRFKIKWQQSRSLSEDYKRGYYLVPNIREKGWKNSNSLRDPAFEKNSNPSLWAEFQSSYAFSLSWSAYTQGPLSPTNPEILDIINCEDTFYEFEYNKVYTVAQFIDNSKFAIHREKFIGIKTIEDSSCEDTTNRYPVNDGVLHTPIQWRIFNFILGIFAVIGVPLLIAYHLIAYTWKWLRGPLKWLFALLCLRQAILEGLSIVIYGVSAVGPTVSIDYGALARTILWALLGVIIYIIFNKLKNWTFKNIKMPLITYPDCDVCECDEPDASTFSDLDVSVGGYSTDGGNTNSSDPNSSNSDVSSAILVNFNSAYLDKLTDLAVFKFNITDNPSVSYSCQFEQRNFDGENDALPINNLLWGGGVSSNNYLGPDYGVPRLEPGLTRGGQGEINTYFWTVDLPFGERVNLFNLKSNYYSDLNGLGGLNQISVKFDCDNPANSSNSIEHLDNVLILIAQPGFLNAFGNGTLFSLVENTLTKDINVKSGTTNSAGTASITGTNINQPFTINVEYANPLNRTNNLSVQYAISGNTSLNNIGFYNYGADLEYFQILTGFTITDFRQRKSQTYNNNSFAGIVESTTRIYKLYGGNGCDGCSGTGFGTNDNGLAYTQVDLKTIDLIDPKSEIIFIQRGVDPYSPKINTKIGLGKLFGFTNHSQIEFKSQLRLNIPVKNPTIGGSGSMVRHNVITTNTSQDNSQYLFFPSYFFTPGTYFSAYTTTNHRFYSRLDRQDMSWRIDNNDSLTTASLYLSPNTQNNTNKISVSFGSNVFVLNSSNIPQRYYYPEFVDGGSYIYNKTFYYECFNFPSDFPNNVYADNPPGPYNFSKIYSTGITINMNSPTRIVMRSDRLPSSSKIFNFSKGLDLNNLELNNTPLFQLNPELVLTIYTDDGAITTGGASYNSNQGIGELNQGDTETTGNSFYNNVLNTFDCFGMVDLDCYTGSGLNFGVDPNCPKGDIVESGCYVFVREPLIGLFRPRGDTDLDNWAEYILRFRFTYGLCQGVLSTVFNNNWINGNLYAFPFKINTYYNKKNQVSKREYPKSLVVLQEETNNFFYRSSPYDGNDFVGVKYTKKPGSNTYNIQFPTTITNLGPKNDFLKYLILNQSYYGYNMNKINSTSYNDLSELINFFSIIRLISTGFWKSLLTVQPLFKLFSRSGRRIDADFAQSAAINSQIGVIPFDADYYTTALPNPQVIAANVNNQDQTMMGIFFQSSLDDLQTRDYISPCRIIRFNRITQSYVYDYIPIKSQVVPFYRWEIQNNGQTIFGTQINEWDTVGPLSRGDFDSLRYQSLDRLNLFGSQYPSPGNSINPLDFRGYIYDVIRTSLNSGTLVTGITYTILYYGNGDDFTNVGAMINQTGEEFLATGDTPNIWTNGSILEPEPIYYTGSTLLNPNPAFVGAPWYFYFGVTRGETALNRFYTKYIGETVLNEE